MTQKISDYVGNVVNITDTHVGDVTKNQTVISSSIGTIIPSDIIRTPVAISPLTGSGTVSQSTTLSAGPYAAAFGRTRLVRRFQVQLVGGNWSSLVYTSITNTDTSAAIAPSLAANTGYEWRCRDETTDNKFSDWSIVQIFSTGATSLQTPTISVQGELSSVPENPVLVGSTFTVIGGTDTHVSTDWEVRKTSDNSLVYSSIGNTTNKTTITVPKGFLLANTSYVFRVKYNGATYTSAFGTKTATTLTQFAYGSYMAVTHITTPYLSYYGRTGDVFTKLSNPVSPPTSNTYSINFSGNFVYIGQSTSPFLNIYTRNGDTLTKISNPDVLPTGLVTDVKSLNSIYNHVGVCHLNSPYLSIYAVSGNSFIKTPNPATLPPAQANAIAVVPNYFATTNVGSGGAFVVAHNGSPYCTVYIYSGSTTPLAVSNAFDVPPTGNATGVIYSATNNSILAISHDVSPFFSVYNDTGDTDGVVPYHFAKVTNPAVLPTVSSSCIAYFANPQIIVLGHLSAPYLSFYIMTFPNTSPNPTTTLTKMANPVDMPTSGVTSIKVSPDQVYLIVTTQASPFVTVYKRSGNTFTKLASTPASLPSGYATDVDFV